MHDQPTCITQPAILNPGSKQTWNHGWNKEWLIRQNSHLHKPSKPGWIVVPNSLCIPKGLQNGVGLQYLLLDPGGNIRSHAEYYLLVLTNVRAGHSCIISSISPLHHVLCLYIILWVIKSQNDAHYSFIMKPLYFNVFKWC